VQAVCGWLICSIVPFLFVGTICWNELKDKYRQLWIRQLALLVADLQRNPPAAATPPAAS
jgi:hypothetical protein